MSIRRLFFVSLLIAAVLAAPVAAAAVVFEAARLDTAAWSDPVTTAMWSARSFLMYFDLLVPVVLVPCALWMWKLRARSAPAARRPAPPPPPHRQSPASS